MNRSPSGWEQALYTGAAGIALAHIEYAHAGAGPWDSARQWVATMTRHPIVAHPDACALDRGAPAIAFTLHAAARPGYAATLATLDGHIATIARHLLDRAHQRIDAGRPPALREYDLIRGLTGIGAHLLHRHCGGELLRDVLAYLVRLTGPRIVGGESVPGWWTANGPTDAPSPDWTAGHANLGLAHGIAGPLALLSLALRREITVAGQAEAVDRICVWLDSWRCGPATRPWWPGIISHAEHRSGTTQQAEPGRPSWCYGTPGLARAQQLAAIALHDQHRQRLAEDALAACLADEKQLGQLTNASLCHGWAGLLQTTWRIARDSGDPERFDMSRLVGRLDRFRQRAGGATSTGLLDGAAGIRLARHTVATGRPPASGWDACLLLDTGRLRVSDIRQDGSTEGTA
jgi:lantibiotic biosynthesis protein